MTPAIMYTAAERAAQWMERSDDRQEAAAIRQLISTHQLMIAGKSADRKPLGWLYRVPVRSQGTQVIEWSELRYCPIDNRKFIENAPSISTVLVFAD